MLEKVANKIKAVIVIVIAGLVTMFVGIFSGRKSQWAKEKEREIEKVDKKIKINEAEIKKQDKKIEKADKVVESAKKDAAKAVQDYADLKKLHDEKIAKAGDDVNVDKPEKYEKQEFDINSDVAEYFNDVLTELNGNGSGNGSGK